MVVPFTILVLIVFALISCVEAVDGNAGAGEGWLECLIRLAILFWTMFRVAQGQGDAPGAGGDIVGNYRQGRDPPRRMYA